MADESVPITPVTEEVKKKFSKKKVLKAIIIATIFIVIGVIGYFVLQIIFPSGKLDYNSAKSVDQLTVSVNKLYSNGDVDKANKEIDEAIKGTDDPKMKSFLLMNKASMYSNDRVYDKALTYALKAESYDSSESSISLIARIFEKMGNNKKAIEYFQKALDYINKNKKTSSNIDDNGTGYYENKIKELNGIGQ